MSRLPSGSSRSSSLCRRRATHTPPVWMPTIAGRRGPSGVSPSAMCASAVSMSTFGFTAVGELIQKRLEDGLGGELVEVALVAGGGHARRGQGLFLGPRGEAVVHHI